MADAVFETALTAGADTATGEACASRSKSRSEFTAKGGSVEGRKGDGGTA